MYPAQKGKGIIAGGPVRLICELAGIEDIVCKFTELETTKML